jgi:hypothetical protein
MQFIARIRLHSYIDRAWRGANKLGGRVHDIPFRRQGLHYVTQVLEPAQVEALRHHVAVELQAFGKLPEKILEVVEKKVAAEVSKGKGGVATAPTTSAVTPTTAPTVPPTTTPAPAPTPKIED